MRRRSLVLVLASLGLIADWGCGPEPDLKGVKLIPQISGYYDDGIVKEGVYSGQNRILPTVTFQLKNEGTLPIEYVDLTVAFWATGKDGEQDSKLIQAIGKTPLQPGATTESLTVRSAYGFTSPHVPTDFFTSSLFVDFKVKVFARRAAHHASLGEITVERRILPGASKSGLHP